MRTATALGAWCHTVLTAVTAQTPGSIESLNFLDTDLVMNQLHALEKLEPEFSPQAFKTGMLGSQELVEGLANFFAEKPLPLVVDTVFKATSGRPLIFEEEHYTKFFLKNIFPIATIVTPNLFESAALLNCDKAQNENEMLQQAQALQHLGAKAVLLKGGHLPGDETVDILVTSKGIQKFSCSKIKSPHTHGSGCTLATAIAVGLAKGLDLNESVALAIDFVRICIQRASHYKLAKSNGPLIQFEL